MRMRLRDRLTDYADRYVPAPFRSRRPLQLGALPYRHKEDGSIELLLVTSRGTGQWIVPKGWPIRGRSRAEAAAQEAYEEAGVRGSIAAEEIGQFDHSKSRPLGFLHTRVVVYLLEVEQELTRWPEKTKRKRRWFTVEEAARAVRAPGLRRLIQRLPEALAGAQSSNRSA
jgi:8-oxo-dGTP pyrophosphatase MutT (NUDIX family)